MDWGYFHHNTSHIMNNPRQYYIEGNDISEDVVKEYLQIQAEQLSEWKVLLHPAVYALLKEWVEDKNDTLLSYRLDGKKFFISDLVARGGCLTQFVLDLPNQPALWETIKRKTR